LPKDESFPSPHVLPYYFFFHLSLHWFLPAFSNIFDLNVQRGKRIEHYSVCQLLHFLFCWILEACSLQAKSKKEKL
ncbi:hypothetical protein VIGAN_04329200, partial [Vigna angularis var. angularis]